jgi:hypothetical protein
VTRVSGGHQRTAAAPMTKTTDAPAAVEVTSVVRAGFSGPASICRR